jgi:hypothetical protein
VLLLTCEGCPVRGTIPCRNSAVRGRGASAQSASQGTETLSDHLVGTAEEWHREGKAKGLLLTLEPTPISEQRETRKLTLSLDFSND